MWLIHKAVLRTIDHAAVLSAEKAGEVQRTTLVFWDNNLRGVLTNTRYLRERKISILEDYLVDHPRLLFLGFQRT